MLTKQQVDEFIRQTEELVANTPSYVELTGDIQNAILDHEHKDSTQYHRLRDLYKLLSEAEMAIWHLRTALREEKNND